MILEPNMNYQNSKKTTKNKTIKGVTKDSSLGLE